MKSQVDWSTIDWRKAEYAVDKLQKRIYQASRRCSEAERKAEGRISKVKKAIALTNAERERKKVRRLQKTLERSFYARCLATRRVTQDNQGKKTAGVDGIKSLSPKMRMSMVTALKFSDKTKPTRRVMIPKPGTTEKRPLGIPTMQDRATQALAKIILEPEWEAKFEANSYGFRPGRKAHDAIEAIFLNVRYGKKWVLDADIAKCFDKIDHKALLRKMETYPKIKRQLQAWLKSGVITSGTFEPTESGTPQGGVISPLLANIALHGLERHIEREMKKEGVLIRYADDFVYIHKDEAKVHQVKGLIESYLQGLGLELKDSKTRITNTENGFDFLGFNIRQYKVAKHRAAHTPQKENLGFNTLIKPSKEAVKRHLKRLGEIVEKHKSAPQVELIRRLNSVIRGWCNYYKGAINAGIFAYCDHKLYEKLLAWAKRRGGNQGVHKTVSKYWHKRGSRKWVFTDEGETLIKHYDTKKVYHVKVIEDRSPFDENSIYWSLRLKRNPSMPQRKLKLLTKQEGKCKYCGKVFKEGDLMEIDHIVPKSLGGKDTYSNLQLIHRHCHDKKTENDGSRKGERCPF